MVSILPTASVQGVWREVCSFMYSMSCRNRSVCDDGFFTSCRVAVGEKLFFSLSQHLWMNIQVSKVSTAVTVYAYKQRPGDSLPHVSLCQRDTSRCCSRAEGTQERLQLPLGTWTEPRHSLRGPGSWLLLPGSPAEKEAFSYLFLPQIQQDNLL